MSSTNGNRSYKKILAALTSMVLAMDKKGEDLIRVPPKEYEAANCAERVVKLILGGAKLSNQWWGISH